ncbi:MAG: hypothetical protein F6K16_28960 [Symploca sp. SIO2B6]|nr:hypothetical protein [Symploca sp. SIO2B6]
MIEQVKVQEFVLVLATKGQNPSILNSDFLRYSGIVPEEMELARDPIYTNQLLQIAYTNGLVITAQPNRIVFSELLQDKTTEDIVSPAIAQKLVEALPKLDYQAVGINPRGYIPMDKKMVSQFVPNYLLAPGPWQEFSSNPVKASINYSYKLEKARLNLSVSEASLQMPEDRVTPVILFSGNIDHVLSEELENRKQVLKEYIQNWREDLDAYERLINTSFLAPLGRALLEDKVVNNSMVASEIPDGTVKVCEPALV